MNAFGNALRNAFGNAFNNAPGNAPIPLRLRSDERGYDFGPYPNSWIQIGWSHEIKRGQVRSIRALGRELVLFRGDDGGAHVLDAFCPHLGAHLGVGGTVVGGELRCPFHGWQFDGQGACTRIPHAQRIPARARVAAFPVREVNGLIFLWHDAAGRAPWFELPVVPEFGSPDWTRPRHYAVPIRTRWREVVENAVDRAHFHALHGYPEPPELELRTDGPRFFMKSRVRWRRFGRELTVTLDIDAHGAGMAVTRGHGEAPFVVLGCPMPVDEHSIVHRMTLIVSKQIPRPIRGLVARAVEAMAVREFRRDVPIWESKIYQRRPVLSDADGPIMRFRSWSKQFYEAPEPAAAQSTSNG